MTENTPEGDNSAALQAIATAIGAASAAHTTAMAQHGARVDALTAAVIAQGQNARQGLDIVASQLASIRACLCDTRGAPETRAMRELALRFGDLPPAQKWAKFQELTAAAVAADA